MLKWYKQWQARRRWMRNARLLLSEEHLLNLSNHIFKKPGSEYSMEVTNYLTPEEMEGVTDIWRVSRMLNYPTNKLKKEIKVLKQALEFKR